MNKALGSIGILALALVLVGCSGGPSSTAEEFLENLASGRISEAKKLASESTGQLLDMASQMGALKIDPDFDFEFVSEEIDGNRATITYRNKADGKVDTIRLVKLDGKWVVHEEKR